MALLTVRNLTKQYKDKRAVDDVSFAFETGKCVALIGLNGAGKTTVMRILAGLLRPTSGSVQFKQLNPNQDIRKFIGYLPQHPVFHSWMTGKEFLVYSGELSNLTKKEATERADHLLEIIGIAEVKNKQISTYSGGMKQRLGISQAIIHDPQLLLLDEPVSALDPIGRREVLQLMNELKSKMTILFSTHILTDADQMSDELLLLSQGKIVESGSMISLRKKYQADSIELRFEKDPDHYLAQITTLSSVKKCDVIQNKIHLEVSDIKRARQEIMSLASEAEWPLDHFIVNEATLEDMFMKVVDQ